MKLDLILPLCALVALSRQAPSSECSCDLTTSESLFPHDKLEAVKAGAAKCNSDISPQKEAELDMLLLGLRRRLPRLQEDVSTLEREDDGQLYGAVSLQVIQNELTQIKQLVARLKSAVQAHEHLTANTSTQLQYLNVEMKELEAYDSMQVVSTQLTNQRLKRDLDRCTSGQNRNTAPSQPPPGNCPHGRLMNVTGPRVYTAGEPGSHKYGAWGRDPKPEAGKEGWYWLVMLTSSNRYGHYVRRYTSLSSLIVAVSTPGNVMIHSSNPTTNTIQGPNVVLHGEALYYNCYNQDSVCRFNLTSKTVTNTQLPKGTRFNSKGNFCHLDECYLYTDLDLATDESGVWVIYTTTQDFGNLVLSKVEDGEPPGLGQTWRTSLYKQGVTNAFVACGVLYATRYVDKNLEEIFYSLDTATGEERFNVGVSINKMSANIQSLNYSPVDQMLHVYSDSFLVSYKVLFE
ncbi:olfactomedin-4 [Clinocottus analis]|uniref:olfactomedin-4 n=1 Tax=Clinocottus analis TaxID=304258 RepID=UPI0035BF9474